MRACVRGVPLGFEVNQRTDDEGRTGFSLLFQSNLSSLSLSLSLSLYCPPFTQAWNRPQVTLVAVHSLFASFFSLLCCGALGVNYFPSLSRSLAVLHQLNERCLGCGRSLVACAENEEDGFPPAAFLVLDVALA